MNSRRRSTYQMHRAIPEGAEVRAYHHWANMDTLEYYKGFAIKYGLIKVDLETRGKTRSLRNSGKMYGEIAAANGITREIVERYVPGWTPESFPEGILGSIMSAMKVCFRVWMLSTTKACD